MLVLWCVVAVLSSVTATSTGSLEWSDHYANAKQGAAQEQRPLLVVLENANEPSGTLSEQLTSDDGAVELMKQYKLCRMDVNSEYGKRVAAAFGAKQFPFTAITDKSAHFVTYRKEGTMTADQWAQALESHRQGELPAASPAQAGAISGPYHASKVITEWPATIPSQQPGYCPSCARRQYVQ